MPTEPAKPRKAAAAKAPAKRAPRKTPAKATPPPVVLPEIGLADVVEALNRSTDGTNRLVTTLETTEKSNRDSAVWRKRASALGAVAILSLGALIIQTRTDASARSNAAAEALARDKAQDARDAAVAEENRLNTCRNRNAGQRYSRDVDLAQNNVVRELGAPEAAATLDAVVLAAPADSDCDRDGSLTTADYPPEPVATATAFRS